LNRFKILLAQRNSVARIPNPKGMMTTAGPGRTTMASPTRRRVNPMTATAIRRACFNASAGFMTLRKCLLSEPGDFRAFCRCSFFLGQA
jgi:hypothetical protein